MASSLFTAFICILIDISQQQYLHGTSLQLHTLNISYPMKTYGGIGAIFNNILYGLSGFYCETNSMNSCGTFTEYIEFSLNISSIHINNQTNKIYFTNSISWIPTEITTRKMNAIHVGTGTSTSTYINEYIWILHGGCCTSPTQIALKYNVVNSKYISTKSYNSKIPGQNLSDSCNTNDGIYIYSIGGQNAKQSFVSNKVYRYHILFDNWEELNNLNEARFGCSCTFVNNNLYVLGGGGSIIGSKLKTIEIYTNKQWIIIKTTLYTERNQHISITHPNNYIITIGGRDENNNAAINELFFPLTETVLITETKYSRKQFFHAIYKYDINTNILFLFGGNFNKTVFNDIKYIILSKNDKIVSIFPTPTVTNNLTTTIGINDSVSFSIHIGTLMIVLICIGICLLIICILILIFMIYSRKNNLRRTSRIHLQRLPNSSIKSPKIIQRNRFISRLEGVPKLNLINKQRKSSEGIRKNAIDEQTNKYIEVDLNNNNISTSEQESSSIEKMYVVSVDDIDDENEMKITPKNTLGHTLDGEEIGYDWIVKTLKKCDKNNWKIYLKNFKKNKVTEMRLIHSNDDTIWMELIPELGIRVQFKQLWKERQMRKGYTKTKDGNI